MIANQATGKIKLYQIIVGSTLMSVLPISYVILKLGAPAESVFIVSFAIEVIAQLVRIFMSRKFISLPLFSYFKNVYVRVGIVLIISIILPSFVKSLMGEGILRLITVVLVSLFSISLSVYVTGLTKREREWINSKIIAFGNRLKHGQDKR